MMDTLVTWLLPLVPYMNMWSYACLEAFYSNVEHDLVSYDVMCVFDRVFLNVLYMSFSLLEGYIVYALWSIEGWYTK